MKPHTLKDKVLINLSDSSQNHSQIKLQLGLMVRSTKDEEHLKKHLKDMIEDGYISVNEYLVYKISPDGRFFIKSGGYTKIYRKQVAADIWYVTKSAAAVLNSIAIIYLGYLTYQATDRANEDRSVVEQQKNTIKQMQITIDSLIKSHHVDTAARHK